MGVNFRLLMSETERQCLDATGAEINRLYGLPDRFLARELMRLCRALRAHALDNGDRYIADLENPTYNTTLLWKVIPDLAKRLGETEFLPSEGGSYDIVPVRGQEYRDLVGAYIQNSDIGRRFAQKGDCVLPGAAEILSHDVANGNPLAIALDRIVPPTLDSQDYVVKIMREIGARRFDGQLWLAWTPAFQDYKTARAA